MLRLHLQYFHLDGLGELAIAIDWAPLIEPLVLPTPAGCLWLVS
jgi:hypothetical protein